MLFFKFFSFWDMTLKCFSFIGPHEISMLNLFVVIRHTRGNIVSREQFSRMLSKVPYIVKPSASLYI